MGKAKVFILLIVVTLLFIIIGRFLLGSDGVVVFFGIALVFDCILLFFSHTLVLSMAHAQPMSKKDYPHVFPILHHIAKEHKIPEPKLYITPDPQPNAFITGRNFKNTHIAITIGALETMTDDELESLLGFQIGKIMNRTVFVSTFAATLAGFFTEISQTGQFSILASEGDDKDSERGNSIHALILFVLAPIASMIIKYLTSNNRIEQKADFFSASYTRKPEVMATTLEKMNSYVEKGIPLVNPNPSLAHLYTINPFFSKTLSKLFSTHVPLNERIEKLKGMTV